MLRWQDRPRRLFPLEVLGRLAGAQRALGAERTSSAPRHACEVDEDAFVVAVLAGGR